MRHSDRTRLTSTYEFAVPQRGVSDRSPENADANTGGSPRTEGFRERQAKTRRPSKARPSVTSSAYSRSPPTGRPDASLLTLMPMGPIWRAR